MWLRWRCKNSPPFTNSVGKLRIQRRNCGDLYIPIRQRVRFPQGRNFTPQGLKKWRERKMRRRKVQWEKLEKHLVLLEICFLTRIQTDEAKERLFMVYFGANHIFSRKFNYEICILSTNCIFAFKNSKSHLQRAINFNPQYQIFVLLVRKLD